MSGKTISSFGWACRDCLYWVKSEQVLFEYRDIGACQRNPPLLLERGVKYIPNREWPETRASDFCGEFTRREDGE